MHHSTILEHVPIPKERDMLQVPAAAGKIMSAAFSPIMIEPAQSVVWG